jgi:hypothetical protein
MYRRRDRRYGRHRRRRNGVMGSTIAEHEHLGWNPNRGRRGRYPGSINIDGHRSGVLLGHLAELVVDTPSGTFSASPQMLKGLFLAWMPGGQELIVVRRKAGRAVPLSAETINIHRQFHEVEPQRAVTYDRPTKHGMKKVGLIKTITYVIPEGVKSPGKAGAKWVHHFGDHGEEGHGPMRGEKQYPDRFKPLLLENEDGDFIIQRRPGNKYDVTKWIYW